MSQRLLIGIALAGPTVWASMSAGCAGHAETNSGGTGGADGVAGTSGAATGSRAITAWDQSGCWTGLEDPSFYVCYVAIGDLWAVAASPCWLQDALASYTEITPEPALHICGSGSEDNSGWEQVRCFDAGQGVIRCAAFLDGWWVGIQPRCGVTAFDDPALTEIPPDPTQAHCDAGGSTTGWDEVRCWAADSGEAICYGRIGGLWTFMPIKPTCAIGLFTDPERVRIDPDAVACGGSAGSDA